LKMANRVEKKVYAALDIGSSNIKLGLFHPGLHDGIIHVGKKKNTFSHQSGGRVLSDFTRTRRACFQLLEELGEYLRHNRATCCYLGICSHVSSLLEWDTASGGARYGHFPVWMDRTCSVAMDELEKMNSSGLMADAIGHPLPPGTNWLLSKLLAGDKAERSANTVYMQVGDAVFTLLTGETRTHFSSQVSMVHQVDRHYAGSLLAYLGLEPGSLPVISHAGLFSLSPSVKKKLSFPRESFVMPSMADFYAAFRGLQLKENEAFIMGNTSELAGYFSSDLPEMDKPLMHVALANGFVNYGSTSTGGNVISWFIEGILGKRETANVLDELTSKASRVSPGECPLFLPYIEGERAPVWDHSLSASFHGLRSHHRAEHLFRAILESLAFARRQLLELMAGKGIQHVKLGGGTSSSSLLNLIRASVLNRPVLVSG
jgi:sugar (pentulose or hexulose) kinase